MFLHFKNKKIKGEDLRPEKWLRLLPVLRWWFCCCCLLFIVVPIVGVFWLCVLSSFAIILIVKRRLVALL